MTTPPDRATDDAADVSDEHRAWVHRELWALKSRLELSSTYHGRRERFLLTCERLAQALAAITATAAFSKLVDESSKWFAQTMLLVAVASILPLVFAWSSRANTHAVLAGDHRRLLARVLAAGTEISAAQLADFQSQMADIAAGEGATLGALVVDCQNELAQAQGRRDYIVPLTWTQRALMHVYDFTEFEPSAHQKQASSTR